jgi:hypothetical protein
MPGRPGWPKSGRPGRPKSGRPGRPKSRPASPAPPTRPAVRMAPPRMPPLRIPAARKLPPRIPAARKPPRACRLSGIVCSAVSFRHRSQYLRKMATVVRTMVGKPVTGMLILQLLSAEGVTLIHLPRFQPGCEPTRTLCRGAVGERVRHHIALGLSLQPIVAYGRSRLQRRFNISGFNKLPLCLRAVCPYTS